MYYKVILVTLLISSQVAFSQLNATFTTTVNTICNGSDCNYSGPSILINEIMMSPSTGDGSLSGTDANQRGEWIELYNPNICEPVDISCYYLGSNFGDANTNSEAFVLPQGTIIPPGGFCVVRGVNAPAVPSNNLIQNGGNTVEIVMPATVTGDNICVEGGILPTNIRFWFPNAGGWFAFYDRDGVPQDAVSWSTPGATNLAVTCIPTPASCNNSVTQLASYNNISNDRKTVVYNLGAIPNSWGQTLRRLPDGEAWVINQGEQNPTIGDCNDACAQLGSSSCTGTATVNVTGGTSPYTYSWNDSQAQLTQTATGLCAGTYTVTVTDNGGLTSQFNVTIEDFVPTVTIDIPSQICIDGDAFAITNISPIASGDAVGTISGTGVSGTNFNPQTAGVGPHDVTYSYTDENGCSNSAVDNIVVNPLPVVSITNNASPYCISSTPADLTLSPTGGTLSGPGVEGNQFIPSVAGVGSHVLTYAYTDENGCSNSTTVTVVVVSIPDPVITAPDFLCIHDAPVTITATPTGGEYTINGTNGALFNPEQLGAGNHTVNYTYTDPNGCQASASETVNVLPRPTVSINLQSVFCFNPGVVALQGNPTGGTFSGDNVVGNNLNLNGVNPGSYSVSYFYQDANGCENTTTASYAISNPINPNFTYSGDCFQNITFAPTPLSNNLTYEWEVDGTVVSTSSLPVINFPVSGPNPVTLTITDQNNCSFDSTGVILVEPGVNPDDFVVPNVITANSDNINDQVFIPQLLEECLEYSILFVNRWGNLVYEMKDMTSPFRGLDASGNPLSEGIYFYRIESKDLDCESPALTGKCHGFIHVITK